MDKSGVGIMVFVRNVAVLINSHKKDLLSLLKFISLFFILFCSGRHCKNKLGFVYINIAQVMYLLLNC